MNKHSQISKNRKCTLSILIALGLLTQACGSSSGGSSGQPADSGKLTCSTSLNQPSFFEEVSDATALPEEDGPSPLRQRRVKVDIAALKSALRNSNSIRLDLFNDTPVVVKIERTQVLSESNIIMTGHLQDDALSSVTLVVRDNVVVANVNREQGTRYEIQYTNGGTHAIKEFAADSDSPDEECQAVESPVPVDDKAQDNGNETAMAATPVIDMLVAYTPAAAARVGGSTAIKALIQMGITDTNKAFVNSNVNLSVRLVGTLAVAQNDTNNFSADLGRLASRTDGMWDEVHAERARLGADQVTMVGVYPNNTVAGIGYIKAAASTAFTIVKTSAFSIYSFSHELGHNVGLQHSDGYVSSGGRFRTIMAYGTYTRIPRYSNPSLSYLGYVTGSSSQNSSSILNRYGNTTAGLYLTKVPSPTPAPTPAPGPQPSPSPAPGTSPAPSPGSTPTSPVAPSAGECS